MAVSLGVRARGFRTSPAAVTLCVLLAVGALSGAVDSVRLAARFDSDDRMAAWISNERERMQRVMLELAPVVETLRDRVPENGSVWCWSTTEHSGAYQLFFYLETLLYPRAVWKPAGADLMTRPAAIKADAALGSAVVVLHVPGDEDRRSTPPPSVERGRWRVALQATYATVYVLEASR